MDIKDFVRQMQKQSVQNARRQQKQQRKFILGSSSQGDDLHQSSFEGRSSQMKDSVLEGGANLDQHNLVEEVERMFDKQYGQSPVVSRQEAANRQHTSLNPLNSMLAPSEAVTKGAKKDGKMREIIGDPLENDQASTTRQLLNPKKPPGMETLMLEIEQQYDRERQKPKKKVQIKQ